MKLQEESQWQELSAKALEIAKAIGAGIVSSGGFIGGVVSGVSTFVISLIFSFYVLLQKEKLGRQGRQVIYGLLPLRAGRPDAGRPAAVRADLLQLPLRASAWRPAFWARCSSRP